MFYMRIRVKNRIREIVRLYVKEEYVEECTDAIYTILADYVREFGLIRSMITFRSIKNLYNKIFKNVA